MGQPEDIGWACAFLASPAANYVNGQVLLVANSGMLLVKDDSNGFLAEKHSSGVDFAAAVALDDGSFVLVGEDGVFRYPETAQQGASDE